MSPLALLLIVSLAHAEQKSFQVRRGPERWRIVVDWRDADRHAHHALFDLPTADVRADLQEPMRLDLAGATAEVAASVRRAAARQPGVQATVSARGAEIEIHVTARADVDIQQALADLEAERDAAWDRVLAREGYTRIGDAVAPDLARHAADYAADLAPVVHALGGAGRSPRDFADTALGFVQSIPYERRMRLADGYRRPLSVLGRNKGDCDSKTVLFLALMRQAWPDLPLAVALIEGHAFALADLDPVKGDVRLKALDRKWVALEPVGPALRPAGQLDKDRVKAFKKWNEVRLVP